MLNSNFEKQAVLEPQYRALVSLFTSLMSKYNIATRNVSGHGYTNGESTKCPGKYFPMQRFKKDII